MVQALTSRVSLLPPAEKLRPRLAGVLALVLAVVALAAALMLDHQSHSGLMRLRASGRLQIWWEIVTPFGKTGGLAMMLAALWLSGILTRQALPRQGAVWGALAVAASTLPALLTKVLTHRARPYIPPEHLGHLSSGYYQSFPSAESASAFAVALALGDCFPKFRIILLGAACLIAAMRVIRLAHWPSDALAGAALGCAVYAGMAAWREVRALPEKSEM